MGLIVLCAGCSSPEREQAEAEIRAVLGPRAAEAAWRVSLVKVGQRWSVTLDGPGHRARSFVADAGALSESMSEALGERPETSRLRGAGPESSAVLARDRHRCGSCSRSFDIVYETVPDEPQEMVSVACPYCWAGNGVLLAESAAYTQAFRAEKAEGRE